MLRLTSKCLRHSIGKIEKPVPPGITLASVERLYRTNNFVNFRDVPDRGICICLMVVYVSDGNTHDVRHKVDNFLFDPYKDWSAEYEIKAANVMVRVPCGRRAQARSSG